jgi:penicillin-binding protein-related factor A (putative recombinase)
MQTLNRKKKEPPAPHTEAAITKSIRDLLNSLKIFNWKNWGGLMGTKGVPDILGIYKGRFLGIEVKTATGKVSPEQEKFLENIRKSGGIGFVARSLDDVIDNLGLRDQFLV